MNLKVLQITSVHPLFDNRIFYKICRSLASQGAEITLIAPHDKHEVIDGVKIMPLRKFKNRFLRIFLSPILIAKICLSKKADIYHFHDPELIPLGLLLVTIGKRVVYDVHEDYVTGIRQKRYLSKWARPVIAFFFDILERSSSHLFDVIIAERYYERRFPSAILVANYPDLKVSRSSTAIEGPRIRSLLYTGNITEDRGALNHARLARLLPEFEFHFVGKVTSTLTEKMRAVAGEKANLFFYGDDRFVPFSEIIAIYNSRQWLAGLALFPETPHYREKELTKFFEYMSFGLPILASDFPVWRRLIQEPGVGRCFNPQDLLEAKAWVLELWQNEEKWRRIQKIALNEAGRFEWRFQFENLLSLYHRKIAA